MDFTPATKVMTTFSNAPTITVNELNTSSASRSLSELREIGRRSWWRWYIRIDQLQRLLMSHIGSRANALRRGSQARKETVVIKLLQGSRSAFQ